MEPSLEAAKLASSGSGLGKFTDTKLLDTDRSLLTCLKVVGRQGFEPWTPGLKVRCSDQAELTALNEKHPIVRLSYYYFQRRRRLSIHPLSFLYGALLPSTA